MGKKIKKKTKNANHLFKDRLHLVESGKTNNFVSNLNNFLSRINQLNVFIFIQNLVEASQLQSMPQKFYVS